MQLLKLSLVWQEEKFIIRGKFLVTFENFVTVNYA